MIREPIPNLSSSLFSPSHEALTGHIDPTLRSKTNWLTWSHPIMNIPDVARIEVARLLNDKIR